MTTIPLTDTALATFLNALFNKANGRVWQTTVDLDRMDVSTTQACVERMVDRAQNGLPVALPFHAQGTDRWIITGGDPQALDLAMLRIQRALIPSYGGFLGTEGAAALVRFRPEKGPLQAQGAELFPHGYYTFGTPQKYRATVSARLERWAQLESERPPLDFVEPPNYAGLVARFHAATAASQWSDAEQAIEQLDRYDLCSADNLRFLQIELLARQGLWSDIWNAADRQQIVLLRVPRAARAALLTAFYSTIIEPVEQAGGTAAALERFRAEQQSLGTLVSGRFGLTGHRVMAVFAFAEVERGNRDGLIRLLDDAEEPTRALIQELLDSLPARSETNAITDAELFVRHALDLDDLDSALVHADGIPDPGRKLLARIEIAARSADAPLCGEVIREYLRSPADLTARFKNSASLHAQLDLLWEVSLQPQPRNLPALPPKRWQVENWVEWYETAISSPDDDAAWLALQRVSGSFARSFSSGWASRLAELAQQVLIDPALLDRGLFRDATRLLVQDILADEAFPRPEIAADDLYESVLELRFASGERNLDAALVVHALLDALLTHAPQRVETMAGRLSNWFAQPIPTLEPKALDAFELLIDFGARQDQLAHAIRDWFGAMLDWPRPPDESRFSVWQSLAQWSKNADDLVASAEARRAAAGDTYVDAFASLPAGLHIAIFTLRPESAERAADVLRSRNPQVKVSICDSTTLTNRAKHLASTADLPVIVTRCETHALTEGIRPFLEHSPVYPPASGASGIVQAIVAWADQAAAAT